jgi:hypothetical protein
MRTLATLLVLAGLGYWGVLARLAPDSLLGWLAVASLCL